MAKAATDSCVSLCANSRFGLLKSGFAIPEKEGAWAMPEYKVIGNTFSIGPGLNLGDFHGPIVASRDAFYLCIMLRPSEQLAGSVGGVVALTAMKALRQYLVKQKDVLEYKLAELPTSITQHPDWPVKSTDGTVFVVPRSIVGYVRYGYWSSYDLVCGERTFAIGLKFIGRSRVMRFLSDNGWDEKLDRDASPSLALQFAPLLFLAGGAGSGAAMSYIGVALGRDVELMEFVAIGAFIGLVAYIIFHLKVLKR